MAVDSETVLGGLPAVEWDISAGEPVRGGGGARPVSGGGAAGPTVRERFNGCRFADHKERVVDLIARVARVSVETMAIVEAMAAVRRDQGDGAGGWRRGATVGTGAYARGDCRAKYISNILIKKVKQGETVPAQPFVARFTRRCRRAFFSSGMVRVLACSVGDGVCASAPRWRRGWTGAGAAARRGGARRGRGHETGVRLSGAGGPGCRHGAGSARGLSCGAGGVRRG